MAESVEDLDLVPPKSAQKNAQKVLDWRDKHGDEVNGMTRTGWVRANQLAKGEELSPDIVKRMAQFNRHRSNSDVSEEHKGEPWKDAGRVAWLGWGGDAGVDWANRMSERITSIENSGRDTVTTLSYKHDSENDDDVLENVNIKGATSQRGARGANSIDDNSVSLNTYNGYFNDKAVDQENWSDAINRLRQLHGSVRSYIKSLMDHEKSGHERPENVPVFEEPVDTESLEKFVENVNENVDDDTFKDLVSDAGELDQKIRDLFFEMIEHDDFMYDREDFEVEQLLSEEMVKGEDYDDLEGCVAFHVDEEGMPANQAYAVCADKFDVEENAAYSTLEDCIDDRAEAEDISREEAADICMDIMDMEEDDKDLETIIDSRELQDQGDKVRWDASGGNAYGVVDTIEREGTVQAEPEGPEMEGSEDNPAYKIQVYDLEDGEWTGTDTYVVHREDALTVIDDFPEELSEEVMAAGIVPTHEALDDFGTTESEDWGRPDYGEFQDAYDFEEQFADLSEEDKRTVAAHFGRVDNSSYSEAIYSDLQLPHHDPETGDVDRAGVIAARQRLPQSDMPQDTLEAIDAHLTEHLREDFEEEDVDPIFQDEENSEDDYQTETVNNEEGLKNGQLVSFQTDYGKSYGRVKDETQGKYTVQVYRAELGGGWKSSGEEKLFETEQLTEEDRFPDSLNDVFNNNSGSSVSAESVADNESSDQVVDDSSEEEEEVVEDIEPSKVQQVGKKVRTVSEVLDNDQLSDYLERNDINYSVEEFRDLVENF